MRKDKTNHKIIRRTITWAMTIIIALSSIGGNFGVMTVYANESGEEGTSSEPAPANESTPPSAEEAATTAVEAADNAVDTAKAEVIEAEGAIADATTAVGAAATAVNEALNGVQKKDVSTKYNFNDDTKKDLQDYSKQVQADQEDINAIDDLNIATVENSDGSTKDVVLVSIENADESKTDVVFNDYVSEQVDEVKAAADDAKAKLEEALNITTDKVTPEVEAKVEEVKEAAQKAEDAYNAAVDAKNEVVAQKNSAIEQYNLYAMAYGLPKYGDAGIAYTEEEAKAAIETYNLTASSDNQITYMGTQKDYIASEIRNNLTEDQKDTMDSITTAIQTAETEVFEAESAVADAKQAVTDAKKAANDAQNAINKAKKEEEAAKIDEADRPTNALTVSLEEAKTEVAGIDVKTAKSNYEKAARDLANLKAKVEGYVFDTVTLTELKNKIKTAERAVYAAETQLKEAGAAKAAAENYANWAEALVTKHETRVYAQAEKDASGKKVALTENLKEYDLTNEDVRSRKQTDFISVTVDKTSVEVPYAIYKDYVEAMYEKYKATNINYGKGTSTGDNMDVIYWAVDENGNLTGDSFSLKSELETGRYFIGYTFKQEGDGYHIDGVMWDYTKPEIVPTTPDTTPEGGGNPGGGNPGGGNPGGAGRTAGTAGDVLGAKREDIAMVAEEGDVLGATRAPKTSDSAKAILWMLVMGSSAIGAAAALASKRKDA
ncbi:MAG: hypothetical protein ACI4FV_09710 [Lachnospiraceae bacterium]